MNDTDDKTIYTENDKLQAEVRKLKAEIAALKRPFLAQPGSWLAIGAFVASLGVNVAQYSYKETQESLAEVKKTKLENESYALELKKTSLQKTLDDLSGQYVNLDEKLVSTINVMKDANSPPSTVQAALQDLAQSLDVAQATNTEAQKSVKAPISPPDYKTAKELEEKGFNFLIAGKLDDARDAFAASEAAANGYHSSYEIAKLLRQTPSASHDADSRKAILDVILTKFSASATPDQRKQLKALTK